MMNVYAEKVKKYLDEEKIQYSSEDVGEQEENLVVYPSFEAGPIFGQKLKQTAPYI